METSEYVQEELDEARYHLEEAKCYVSNISNDLIVMIAKLEYLMEKLKNEDS